jgi:hypothetical protein
MVPLDKQDCSTQVAAAVVVDTLIYLVVLAVQE